MSGVDKGAILTRLREIVDEFATNDIPTEDAAFRDSDVVADLGCDSLDLISLLFALEAEYEVKIPEDLLEENNLTHIGNLVDHIAAARQA